MAETLDNYDYEEEEDEEEDDEAIFAKLDAKALQDIAGSPAKTPFKPQFKDFAFFWKGSWQFSLIVVV